MNTRSRKRRGECMASIRNLALLVMLLALVTTAIGAISTEEDFVRCQNTVRKWAASSNDEVKEDKHTLQDLLFFLHVPRTGGRTYFHCFLRKLYASAHECPRSYDKLRFDPSKPDCRLMVTHDDYSMMSKLPKERTSVVTILRNPIDRVFSTYEFSVEVAARFLVHPNLTSATQLTGRIRPKNNGVSTLDIWPWKYLVPWMREDLFRRRDARKQRFYKDVKESYDSYNMEETVMPLHDFINHPVAHDIIHNGATFQVAGLTNNSCLSESHEVRHCVRNYQSLGTYVLDIAKKRLSDMLYVGLTEDHKESATMFANVVGTQILSQFEALNSNSDKTADSKTELSSSFPDSEHDTNHLQNSTDDQKESETSSLGAVDTTIGTMTVGKLMDAYEVCISGLRKAQGRRRIASLKRISPANFSKDARRQVPDVILQEINSLNRLDVELYKHAKEIFSQERKHLAEKLLEAVEQKNALGSLYGTSTWRPFLLAIAVLLLLLLTFFIVKARKQTSKLKV
ncbi:hypothetical protein MKW98_003118 [Papaver atlanticum]|uniref:Sulfotransferase n=1 Tax=Papaver atlanticum TaxID=357466 RepID=A0AAD4TEV2_9MAGN|nr:hypothetical protein MKW98_003118 [Papaver atlanticum]